ncbi:hypothetical protein Nepgr_020373 [Nepenthes gracilis]|uniref:Uncharacterized protein n=1 Tax=Nepenthes gracilis TaxID=150966 RepID=A0AAD3SWX7_NEPGR|nr:hypothetical protein Nepgr_020373 [Nepenthes gracilis]
MGGDDHVLADFAGAIFGAALPGASSSFVCLMLLRCDLDVCCNPIEHSGGLAVPMPGSYSHTFLLQRQDKRIRCTPQQPKQQLQQGFATSAPANTSGSALLQLASSTMQLSSFTGHYQQTSKWHSKCQQQYILQQQEKTSDPIRVHEMPKRIGQLVPKTAKAMAKSSANLKAATKSQHQLHLIQQRAYNGLSKLMSPAGTNQEH